MLSQLRRFDIDVRSTASENPMVLLLFSWRHFKKASHLKFTVSSKFKVLEGLDPLSQQRCIS
ncbi:hypothetical protein N665_0126s0082 [Sinapis alba]|nr:hypothetical protein N665_0126s0082 [Sinapis alba]